MKKVICAIVMLQMLYGCDAGKKDEAPAAATARETSAATEERQRMVGAYEAKKDHTEARIDTLMQLAQAMTPQAREHYYEALEDLEKDQRELEDRIAVLRETNDTQAYWSAQTGIDSILAQLERSLEETETSMKNRDDPKSADDRDRQRR